MMALLESRALLHLLSSLLGPSSAPQNVSNFFSSTIPPSSPPIISEMRLQQWPSFAWELLALCFHQRRLSLTDALLNNAIPCSHQRGGEGCRAAPRRIRGAGPLWLARAEHRCQLPSVMIAYLWTFNLSKACRLAEGSRRFGALNRFDNRHYHCEGPGEKRHQRVNCGWRCKLSLLISFNTCVAWVFSHIIRLTLANIWKCFGRQSNPWITRSASRLPTHFCVCTFFFPSSWEAKRPKMQQLFCT